MRPEASYLVTFGIAVLSVAVGLLAAAGYSLAGGSAAAGSSRWRRFAAAVAAIGLWMTVTALLAEAGLLARFDLRPPPFGVMVVVMIALGALVGFSRVGDRLGRLPLAWLVAAQGFRLPLELVMHRAADERVMPVQMSFSGYNFDIVTGTLALVVALLYARGLVSTKVVLAWNLLGSVLLAVIVGIAIVSTPTVGAFGTEPERLNTWVAYFPFVWLPAVLVVAALVGHIVIFRKLARAPHPAPS
jgi:hypothetical protein